MANNYWTEQTTQAIMKYQTTNDEVLFADELYPAFNTMCECIIGKFRGHSDKELQADMVSYLWQKIPNYDYNKQRNSFYYFSRIAFNYIHRRFNPEMNRQQVPIAEVEDEYLCNLPFSGSGAEEKAQQEAYIKERTADLKYVYKHMDKHQKKLHKNIGKVIKWAKKGAKMKHKKGLVKRNSYHYSIGISLSQMGNICKAMKREKTIALLGKRKAYADD